MYECVREKSTIHINEAPKHPALHLLREPREIRHTLLNPSHLFLGCEKLCKKSISPCNSHLYKQNTQRGTVGPIKGAPLWRESRPGDFYNFKVFCDNMTCAAEECSSTSSFLHKLYRGSVSACAMMESLRSQQKRHLSNTISEDILKHDAIQWQFSGRD